MKRLAVLVAATSFVLAALFANSAPATEDLGIPDPLTSACHFAASIGEARGLNVGSCRTAGEIVYRHDGRSAIVPVSVRANGVTYELNVYVEKSLWYGSALVGR